MEHQVAGHAGNIIAKDGRVVKLQTHNELPFYKQTVENPLLKSLKGVIPQYYGEATIKEQPGIELEDLTYGFRKPCIMDLKLGKVLYGTDASPEKRDRMIEQANTTTSGSTGLRICGMKLYTGAEYSTYDKSYGRSLTKDTLHQGFDLFFSHDKHQNLKDMIQKVDFILDGVKNAKFSSGGCSLLLIYDYEQHKSDVRLIDFAHAALTEEPDQDLIWALESLRSFLKGVKTQ
jgi:1D-myo-inositol-tetrakisphosphate 5-kinase/inositol-polyphosphate multikinase